MLKILLVPVIMACAVGGTVGILKVIGKVFPGGVPRDPITKKIEDELKKVGSRYYGLCHWRNDWHD